MGRRIFLAAGAWSVSRRSWRRLPPGRKAWPNRPVRLVVPFPAGGPADALGRVLADQLNKIWGQPVVIENRGGAGGNLGAEVVARAAPDGYTLLLNASSHVINASLYEKLPYDAIKDFTPVSEVASYMLVLVVHPSVPATSVKEFVAFAKSKPDGLSVANAGLGTPTHLAAVLFAQAAGVEPDPRAVSRRRAGEHGPDRRPGARHVQQPGQRRAAGQGEHLRALAVTGSKRLSLLPDLPTVAESGYPGFETRTWYGLFGPAGLPADIVRKLHADMERVLRMPEVTEQSRRARMGHHREPAGPVLARAAIGI